VHNGPPRAARRLGHRPALDGLRGIAWGVVFVSHAVTLKVAVGQVSMFVFFALSGFLITGLLLEEHAAAARVSLGRFFTRRALRLLPALVFFLAGWLVVVLATGGHAAWTTTVPNGGQGSGTSALTALEGTGAALAYVTNWAEACRWFTGYVPLGHLWSLAVEEQFYLLWSPAVALLVTRRSQTAVLWAAGAAAVASFVDVALRDGGGLTLALDMSTDTRAGAFLVGAVVAVAWARGAAWARAVEERGARATAVLSLGVMGWGSWVLAHHVARPLFAATWIAVSVAAGLLVVSCLGNEGRRGRGIASSAMATYVGRRSYALYLWHYVWLTWLAGLGLAGIPLALGASVATAELSWRLVERPALALKRRFSGTPGPPLQPPAPPARLLGAPAQALGHATRVDIPL